MCSNTKQEVDPPESNNEHHEDDKEMMNANGSLDGNGDDDICPIHFRIIQLNDVYTLDNFPSVKTLIDEYSTKPFSSTSPSSASSKITTTIPTKTIVVCAGDFVAPSLLSSLDRGRGMVDVMTATGITHVCLGNHEADIPIEALKQHIQGDAHHDEHHHQHHTNPPFEWINSNMRELDTLLNVETKESSIIQLGNKDGNHHPNHHHERTIMVLGLLSNDQSLFREGAFMGATQTMEDPIDCYERLVVNHHHNENETNHTKLDLVIPMTHQDMADDIRLAKRFGTTTTTTTTTNDLPHLKAIIGGHDHGIIDEIISTTTTTNGPDSSTGTTTTPSTTTTTTHNNTTRIVKTGMDAHQVGVWDFIWLSSKQNEPIISMELIATNKYPKNPMIQDLVNCHHQVLAELEQTNLFEINTVLTSFTGGGGGDGGKSEGITTIGGSPRDTTNDGPGLDTTTNSSSGGGGSITMAEEVENEDEEKEEEETILFSTKDNRYHPTVGSMYFTSILRRGFPDADCAIVNAGGIRGNKDYEKPWFTLADLKCEFPFSDPVTTITLPGHVLVSAIYYSRQNSYEDPPQEDSGFLHTCDAIEWLYHNEEEGIEYEDDDDSYDDEPTIVRIGGRSYVPHKMYRTVVPVSLLQGMDNNVPLLNYMQEVGITSPNPDTGRPIKIVIVEYFALTFWLGLGKFSDLCGEDAAVDIKNGKNAYITREQVQKSFEQKYGVGTLSDILVDDMMAVADVNGTGQIDLHALLAVRLSANLMTQMKSHRTHTHHKDHLNTSQSSSLCFSPLTPRRRPTLILHKMALEELGGLASPTLVNRTVQAVKNIFISDLNDVYDDDHDHHDEEEDNEADQGNGEELEEKKDQWGGLHDSTTSNITGRVTEEEVKAGNWHRNRMQRTLSSRNILI